MPTETFLKLPQEKKNKIIKSAKLEFTRANLQEASIKNIAQGAEMARASFYQYFESKEDLLNYILTKDGQSGYQKIIHILEKAKGDLFEASILFYDDIIQKSFDKNNMAFYQKVFENIKTSQDTIFTMQFHQKKKEKLKKALTLINVENLRIQKQEDLMIMINMLMTITKKAVVSSFQYDTKELARENYLRQLEMLQYGMLKKKEEKDV